MQTNVTEIEYKNINVLHFWKLIVDSSVISYSWEF